jgi:hypothetical protein
MACCLNSCLRQASLLNSTSGGFLVYAFSFSSPCVLQSSPDVNKRQTKDQFPVNKCHLFSLSELRTVHRVPKKFLSRRIFFLLSNLFLLSSTTNYLLDKIPKILLGEQISKTNNQKNYMRQIWYSMSLQYYLCRKYLHIKVYLRVSKYMHICISIICEFSNTQVNLFSPGNYNCFYLLKSLN